MPLLRYFLTVGAMLTAALFAASAYLESKAPVAAAHVSVAPTTASLYIPPPATKPASTATAAALYVAPAPAKPAKRTKR
jgi:hypothetical protein